VDLTVVKKGMFRRAFSDLGHVYFDGTIMFSTEKYETMTRVVKYEVDKKEAANQQSQMEVVSRLHLIRCT
jgi:hypothetical protein